MGPPANSSSIPEDICSSDGLLLVLLRTWLISYLLLLPLFLSVIHVGYMRAKRQQSALSHSDVFTFHIIAMEILTIAATGLYAIGIQASVPEVMRVSDHLFNVGGIGQMFIHCLTCVERYLAVAHPMAYRRLKERGGVTIRNTCIAVVWILSAGVTSLSTIPSTIHTDKITTICVTLLSVLIVSFCSVSVLCILIRPGPAERGRELKRVDQVKRRAFFTMVAIMGVLMIRFGALVSAYLVAILGVLSLDDTCVLSMAAAWLYLPSSIVLPLIFLHKEGKLPKCSH